MLHGVRTPMGGLDRLTSDILALPRGIRVVLADPPWLFRSNSLRAPGRNARRHYGCLTVDEAVSAAPGRAACRGRGAVPVGAIVHGISGELQRLLQQHDGETRSLPSRSLPRSNGTLIEHDANDGSDGNNGSGGALH